MVGCRLSYRASLFARTQRYYVSHKTWCQEQNAFFSAVLAFEIQISAILCVIFRYFTCKQWENVVSMSSQRPLEILQQLITILHHP